MKVERVIKKRPTQPRGNKSRAYCLGENSCLHESNKLSPDPMYEDQEKILFQTGKQKTSGEKWEKVDVRSDEKDDQADKRKHLEREA